MALVLTAGGLALALSGAARAETNSVMSTCSAQYNADKAAGKIATGQTWPQYYSACAAQQKAASGTATTTTAPATTTTTAPATTAKPAAPAATATTTTTTKPATTTATTTKPATTAPAATTTTTTATKPATTAPAATTTADTSGGNTTMSTCSAQYKLDKAANKVPAGQTWPQYYSACATALKASADQPDPTPPEPTAAATTTKAATSTAVATTDANGKTLSPGQIAAQQRIKTCGGMWTADKNAGKIAAGQTWPQYWSACNTKLKAAGN